MDINLLPTLLKKFFAMLTVLSLLFAGIGGTGTETTETEIKNVIFFIGDGMGPNHLEKTKAETGEELFMDTLPVQGFSKTSNYIGGVTDSAAGATALACGIRTANGRVGVYYRPLCLCKLPHEPYRALHGKRNEDRYSYL